MLKSKLALLLVAVMSMFATASQAAITALEIAPIQTDIETTITNVTPAVISIMAVVLGITIGVKLVKKLIGAGS